MRDDGGDVSQWRGRQLARASAVLCRGTARGRKTRQHAHRPSSAFQRGASQAPIFDPRDGSDSQMDRLLEEMNAYLDSLGVSTRLVDGRRVSAVAHAVT